MALEKECAALADRLIQVFEILEKRCVVSLLH